MGKDDLESRFRKMEVHLAYLAGVGTVVLAFLGVTYLHTIPKAIEETINKHVGKETLKKITDAKEKAESILSVTELQEKVQELQDAQKLCADPVEECICKLDGGSSKAKLVVCVSRCPDGRLKGIKIKELVSTSHDVSCANLKSKVFW